MVTGGAGFIGSNFIRYILDRDPDVEITNVDLLTYAGVERTVKELDEHARHTFIRGDVRDPSLVDRVVPGHEVIIHFAAESHVDRSITSPAPFLSSNFDGTGVLLDAATRHGAPLFVQVSTDEVYGSIVTGHAAEDARLAPSSPYSSSKAGADLLALSYHITYGLPVMVTRCTNNYGPYQFPEKVIPLFVTNLLDGNRLPLYGDGGNQRDWLFVDDHCAALRHLIQLGTPGEIYNIGANQQLTNLELATRILDRFGLDESWIDYVTDRPGHDYRYAVDTSKIRSLGWAPTNDFDERLTATIDWYRSHEDWWRPLRGAQ
ncbi:MAG: dTDP-glucose 4,6-dehydratase [Actinobacteria bacterium]|nr:dTDP-glucose 4,6-dehydratase [Actinomycetota bacterium]